MKFYLYNFYANNPDMKLEDAVTDFRAGVDDNGIVHIHITTMDKYVRIDTGCSVSGCGFKGELITIRPFIYDDEGDCLHDKDYEVYSSHPDWYRLEFLVEFSDHTYFPTMMCTPLKYEYYIIAIPHNIAFNYDVLKEVELLDLDEEE